MSDLHQIGTSEEGFKVFTPESQLETVYYSDQDGNKVELPRATAELEATLQAWLSEFGGVDYDRNSSDSPWLETAYQDIPSNEQGWLPFSEFEQLFIDRLEKECFVFEQCQNCAKEWILRKGKEHDEFLASPELQAHDCPNA